MVMDQSASLVLFRLELKNLMIITATIYLMFTAF